MLRALCCVCLLCCFPPLHFSFCMHAQRFRGLCGVQISREYWKGGSLSSTWTGPSGSRGVAGRITLCLPNVFLVLVHLAFLYAVMYNSYWINHCTTLYNVSIKSTNVTTNFEEVVDRDLTPCSWLFPCAHAFVSERGSKNILMGPKYKEFVFLKNNNVYKNINI